MKRIVKSIEVKNYKAFKEGTLHLDPFSLLIGTNSSGKSSLLKLILMLAQSNDHSVKNFITPYGTMIDLGENKNIFFNQDVSKTLTLKFNLDDISLQDSNNFLRRAFSISYIRLIRALDNALFDTSSLNDINLIRKYRNEFSELSHNARRLFERYEVLDLEQIKNHNDKIRKYKLEAKKNLEIIALEDLSEQEIFESEISDERGSYKKDTIDITSNEAVSNIFNSVKTLYEIEKIKHIKSIEFKIKLLKESLVVTFINIITDSGYISISKWNEKTKRSSVKIESNILNADILNKKSGLINKNMSFNAMSVRWRGQARSLISDRLSNNIALDGSSFIFCYLIQSITHRVRSDFFSSRINHVNPLRFNPERYFLMDKNFEQHTKISIDGKQILSILDKQEDVKHEINLWLKKFDLEVNTNDITHIIQSIKITDNGLSLDITDVGFGISQILPVILMSVIAKPGQLTIIEQPEIHIHPKMQSELADFFIDQIVNKNKYFLIETHSEALLKRLRRRMAEHNSNNEIGISNESVAIHYIDKRQDRRSGSQLTKVKISQSGAFEWPKDFNDNDIQDTIAFMQHQG